MASRSLILWPSSRANPRDILSDRIPFLSTLMLDRNGILSDNIFLASEQAHQVPIQELGFAGSVYRCSTAVVILAKLSSALSDLSFSI